MDTLTVSQQMRTLCWIWSVTRMLNKVSKRDILSYGKKRQAGHQWSNKLQRQSIDPETCCDPGPSAWSNCKDYRTNRLFSQWEMSKLLQYKTCEHQSYYIQKCYRSYAITCFDQPLIPHNFLLWIIMNYSLYQCLSYSKLSVSISVFWVGVIAHKSNVLHITCCCSYK